MKLLLALPLVLLIGCKNAAPGYVPVAPPVMAAVRLDSVKSARELMPLGVGNLWKYALHDERYDAKGKQVKNQDLSAEIEIESRWPDGTAVLAFRVGGEVVDRQAWVAKRDGLYLVQGGVKDTPVRPLMPLFLLPLKTGERTLWRGRAPSAEGDSVRGNQTIEVFAPQSVSLRQGLVSAIPVSSEQTLDGVQINSLTFFQPGTGIVRLQQENRSKGTRETLIFTLLSHATKS